MNKYHQLVSLKLQQKLELMGRDYQDKMLYSVKSLDIEQEKINLHTHCIGCIHTHTYRMMGNPLEDL